MLKIALSMLALSSVITAADSLPPSKRTSEFVTAPQVITNREPVAAAIGDLNGDGKPDLVVTQYYGTVSGTVSVLLGNGDGTFQQRIDYETGSEPSSIVIADFNGDGELDVAVADYQNPGNLLSVFLGNGDGTLRARVEYPTGLYPLSVKAADFNQDGKLDLVVAAEGNNTVELFLGNGDGTFQEYIDIPTGMSPTSIAVGDLNGDGKLDVVTADDVMGTAGAVSVLLGNGDGTFQTHMDFQAGTYPYTVALGDFNGDHHLDLAVTNSRRGSKKVSILLGNGDGTFQAPVGYETGPLPYYVAVADFNGDGRDDLAVADGNEFISILFGKGDGTFLPQSQYATGNYPVWVAVGDLNGDGAVDVVSPNADGYLSPGTVTILLNTGGTRIGLTSSPNPSTVGQAVTFTATVKAGLHSSGLPAPGGSVTFFDGTTTLGMANIVNGAASLATSALSEGSHKIRAQYPGDRNYNPNSAVPITQVVEQ